MRLSAAVTSSVLLLLSLCVSAGTLYVTPDGMGDVPTIQAAVDSVAPGDTVLLASGLFRGAGNYNIVIPAKSFVMMSETGDPGDCIIDCEGHLGSGRRGFHFQTSWSTGPAVYGITIRNGNVSTSGGAVLSDGTVTMRDCVFESNLSGYVGGALSLGVSGEVALKNCGFVGNEAAWYGGAMYMEGVELYVTVDSCTFYGNDAAEEGGAICCYQHEASAYILNSVFVQNSALYGGGISVINMYAFVGNCTFHANHATIGSGIATGTSFMLDYALADVHNSIIAYGTGGGGYYQPHYNPSDHSLQCTNIYGNEGGDYVDSLLIRLGVDGNFSAAPGFCDPDLEPYDLSLCDNSPCLPGNHPDGYACGLIGALGEGCICEPTRTEPSTWGAIKAMYK